ncbi:MAG: hypothetical protein ACI9K5_002061 [Gammaproteobacteria bacterium]
MLPAASDTASAQSLINGGVVSGNISLPGEVDSYTFSANAGEGFQIRLVDVNATALLPVLSLFDPSGTFVTSGAGFDVGAIVGVAGMTGTYSLVVADGNSAPTGSGAYDIHYVRLAGANEGGPLLDGITKLDSITQGDLDSFTLAGETGDAAVVTVTDLTAGSLLPAVSLYGPTGPSLLRLLVLRQPLFPARLAVTEFTPWSCGMAIPPPREPAPIPSS